MVTERNSGDSILHAVTVTGGGACPTWTAVGVFNGILTPGSTQQFECTFTAGAPGTTQTWEAHGQGLDSLNTAVPRAGEDQSGSVRAINPVTRLDVTTPPPATVHGGDPVTIVVTENNTGDDPLSDVHVTGGVAFNGVIQAGVCADWTPVGPFSLAVGASLSFTCTFTAGGPGTDITWFADGQGVDSLGRPVPSTGEHQRCPQRHQPGDRSVDVQRPPPVVAKGATVTVTVRETNTGSDPLTNVSVTGSPCATWTPAGPINLAAGAFQDFSCTFPVNTTVNWSADGHGTDSLGNPVPTGPGTPEHQQGTVAPAAIHIVKKTNGTANACPTGPVVAVGSTVTWTYEVTNPGEVPISNVVVTDNQPGVTPAFASGDTNNDGKLDPTETWVFSATGIATAGQYSNVATVNGAATVATTTVPLTATDDDCYFGATAVVTTAVRDAAGHDVTNTTVPSGTVVHDEATVAKAAGVPAVAPGPSGTVSFTLYDNGTCNGAVVATDPNKPLSGGIATSANFTPPAAGGTFSYLAHYNGDANYPARNGPCEPFTRRDAADRPDHSDQRRVRRLRGRGTVPWPDQLQRLGWQDRPEHQPRRVLLLDDDHDHGPEPGRDRQPVQHEHQQRRAVHRPPGLGSPVHGQLQLVQDRHRDRRRLGRLVHRRHPGDLPHRHQVPDQVDRRHDRSGPGRHHLQLLHLARWQHRCLGAVEEAVTDRRVGGH